MPKEKEAANLQVGQGAVRVPDSAVGLGLNCFCIGLHSLLISPCLEGHVADSLVRFSLLMRLLLLSSSCC